MNYKHFFFGWSFFLSLIFANLQYAQAQVEDIKKESEQNSNGSSENGGGSDAIFFIDLAFDFFTFGYQYHLYQLSNEEEMPEITSIEVHPTIGYANGNTIVVAPRIRGNWGLLTADFRYFNLVGGGLYQTLDGQFLMNVVNEKAATLRIGTGFMHEYFNNGQTYNEHFFGLDTRWGKEQNFTSNIEFRIAKDYSTGATPRLEFNVRLNQKIFEKGRIVGYWTVGGIYQRYFNEVNVWTGQTGLSFALR
ncbi:MAG: hypothetical protein ACPGVB_11200 [Chitinophagales bacterium]